MGLETERKFLVNGSFIEYASGSKEIIQAYLAAGPEKAIRLRIAGEEAWLTVKSGSESGSISRGEWEYRIPVNEAIEMLPLCIPGKIVKTRYFVPAGKHTWEVDVFHDRNEGLVIAEIELGTDDESFEKPGWLGEEVTGNPAYYNSNLVK